MAQNGAAPDPVDDSNAASKVGSEYNAPVNFGNEPIETPSPDSPQTPKPKQCSDCCSASNSTTKRKPSRPGPLARRHSSLEFSDSKSHCGSSTSDFVMYDVDISKNYGNGTVPVRGRESHTADLVEFDRYISMLEEMDREREERLWKIGVSMGMNNVDDDEDDSFAQEGLGELNEAMEPPHNIDISSGQLPLNGDVDFEKSDHLSDCDELHEESHLRFPFNQKFWSYFRSILANAKPVGFSELEDPTATIVKGPEDATAFISKVIAIKSINPIQPSLLASEGGFKEEDVLAELLYATSVGLVAMRFAPECIQCGSAVMDTDMLGRVPNRAPCNGCNAPNLMDSLEKIKVLFLLNADVLYVLAENFACTPSAESMSHTKVFAAVPATSTGSGFSYCIGTGPETEIAPELLPGKYRMHCPVAKTDNYLVVRRKSSDVEKPVTLRMKVSDLVCKHDISMATKNKAVLTVPHGKIQFDVIPDTKSFFVLWIQSDVEDKKLLYLPQEERDVYTAASKVMHHPIFNALFQEQQVVAVPKDIFFSISNVVLVFTDIVDSTKLYTNLGDGEAFRIVRKHFQVLFAAFIKRGGRVVKTIGDAVMASFTTGRAAMMGVADAMKLLPTIGRRPDNQNYIEIRVGVHCGKVTVVPLNGVNDYFGQTTNIAARVQSVAKASECFVTKAVLESSPDSWDCYKEIVSDLSFVSTPATELSLKGVEHKVCARGFRWVKRSKRQSELSSSFTSLNTYYSDRRDHTRISYRDIESDEFDMEVRNMRLFDRPAETGRRNSNFDPTLEDNEDEA